MFGPIPTITLPIVGGDDDDALELAISNLPEFHVNAVLIKNHGVLAWDGSWELVIER